MDFAQQRLNMVEGQLRPSRVVDARILDAAGALARERFLPPMLQGVAYTDEDLPLGQGRYLMEPLVLARLIQAAEIAESDVVLVVGCTSGYGAAIAGRMARRVVALEVDRDLADQARANLRDAGITTVKVAVGPLAAGWPAEAPYHAIIIEGAVPSVPRALLDQMAEGGRLAAVLRTDRSGKAMLQRKLAGVVSGVELFDAACPLLPGFAAKPGFVF